MKLEQTKHNESKTIFQLSFKYRFEAAHRLTHSSSPSCMTPHGHTWYAKAVFEAHTNELNSDDMIMEFSKLKSAWKKFIQETADHSFMHHHADPILQTLKREIPEFRGLPFPGDPTTEMIAALFFCKLKTLTDALAATLEPTTPPPTPALVAIRETPTNSVTFRPGQLGLLNKINRDFDGWWLSADPGARHIKRRTGPTKMAKQKPMTARNL